MAIPYLINLTLQLQDEGRLSLDDTVSKWLPEVPNADQVTLQCWRARPPAIRTGFRGIRRSWMPSSTIPSVSGRRPSSWEVAFDLPLKCEPARLLQLRPHQLRDPRQDPARGDGPVGQEADPQADLRPARAAAGRHFPAPGDAGAGAALLHLDRSPSEDATFWSPSWTVGKDSIMSGTVGNVARTARAIGTGALISREASREQFSPATTMDYPGSKRGPVLRAGHRGGGLLALSESRVGRGAPGYIDYPPEGDISVALTVTTGQHRGTRPASTTARGPVLPDRKSISAIR